jgi:hypothetical protein
MKTPVVSVIVPTFNRAALLPRCLDSILVQSFTDWEIVLIDDASTDNTEAVARDYERRTGGRVRFAKQDHRGPGAARNHGIEQVRGRFVAFLDSDDEFAPTKFARQLDLFARQPELGFVYSDYSCIDGSGGGYVSAFDEKFKLARSVPCAEVAPGLFVCTAPLFDALFEGYFVATITGRVRRDVLGRSIRFDPSLRYGEEWLFYLHVARSTPAGFVNEPLSIHHAVPGSLARTDRVRNTLQFVKLLQAMKNSFPNLTRKQRASLRARTAAAWRQAGYDAVRGQRPRDAARAFLSAFRQDPRAATLAELIRAFPRALFQRSKPTWTENVCSPVGSFTAR